jgi:hypothetical protein
MAYVGKINQQDLAEYIIPAYDNYFNLSYDIGDAKEILKNFIVKFCKTQKHQTPPTNRDKYIFTLHEQHGFTMSIRNDPSILYLFDVKSGSVYVSEDITKIIVDNDLETEYVIPFDDLLDQAMCGAAPIILHHIADNDVYII